MGKELGTTGVQGIHLWMRNCCNDVVQSFSKTREGGESSSGTCTVVRTSVQNNYDLRPVNFSFVAIAQDQQAEQLPSQFFHFR